MRRWSLLWRYLLIKPSVASCGVWSIATDAFVPAFGRNDVPDDRLHRIADELRRLNHDEMATLAALRSWLDPGQPNRELARSLVYLLNTRPLVVAYVQWEVAVAMSPLEIEHLANRIRVLWPPHSGEELDSLVALDRAIELGYGLHASTVMVLAHRLMLVRVILMVRRRLHRSFVAGLSGAAGFDPRSVQPHTARPWLWYLREAIGRLVILPFRRLV